ncbi:MAG: HPr family phosphocarrier protein [Deltaproteobacteria bacterium]|jgi:phosphotransferase system HPr (HPr) family protein|nr:HPr family phosphocarrier protein [Deltaproteobacteria bacterium]
MNEPAPQLAEDSLGNDYQADPLGNDYQNDPPTLSATLTIKNRLGLHARAAGKLVEAAGRFKSRVLLVKDDAEADIRSIVSLISLGCPYNTEVVLLATGPDAPQALAALTDIIDNRFGEA